MNKFNHYKSLTVKAVREGIEDHKKGEKKPHEIGKEIFEENKRYKKVVSAVDMVMELMPEAIFKKLKKALTDKDYSELPFDLEKYNFKKKIGKGFISKVHLLESKKSDEPSYVLKIDFYNEGSVKNLHKIAMVQQVEYEKIKENFKAIIGLIPKEQTLITTDKKNKTPVIATLQEFVGRDLRDIFVDIEKDELIKLLNDNEKLREEFLEFERIASSMAKNEHEVVDLLGEKNLSIVQVDDEPHLRFIDPHDLSSTVSDNKRRDIEFQSALEYLSEIRRQL